MADRRFLVAVLLVSLLSISSVPACNAQQTYSKTQVYNSYHLDALQVLWDAWNTSTPDAASNLAGWSSTQEYPCNQYLTGDHPNWRGVECLTNMNCQQNDTARTETCYAYVIGLKLNNASIVGSLPPDIGNITTLTTLELTGNAELTGLLPKEIGSTQLITLDIRDNAFYGEFPDFGSFEWPQTLIISGNRFSGIFPLYQIKTMQYLQTLSLERNDFEGEIPSLAFENITQLVHLDLSDNKFNGTLPTFSVIKFLQYLDVSNNKFVGSLPNLTTMSSILTLDFSNNKLSGTLPSLTSIKSIQHLNLSRNAFTGPVVLSPPVTNSSLSVVDLSYNQLTGSVESWNNFGLDSLQELYLDGNNLTGTLNINILYELLRSKSSANSSRMLRVFSLINNSISDIVYDQINIEEVTTIFRLQGNPFCASPDANDGTRCFCQQICFNSASLQNQDNRKVIIIVVVTVVSCLLILLISLAALYRYNRRYQRYLELQVKEKFDEAEVKPTIFPFQQLRTATRDFHPDTKLGQGAYGAVFKGVLLNGNEVAVKQLFAKANQDIDDFLNEVVMLTGMKHRNLMNLKGCCVRDQQRLLVYEYVDNHDIDHVLLSAGKQKALLSWPVRMKILLGVARGLHYLHALAHPKIIHRDIKASNILLTQNYEAKIADFGLALLFPEEESYIMTKHVAGTQGYMAPEYASFGQLSDKVDVFSFGVLCLEVVSGRRIIDHDALPNKIYLSKWAWEVHREGRLMEMVDTTLTLQDDEVTEVERVINIALLCIQNAAEQRPSMERVVAMLQGGTAAEVAAPQDSHEEAYLESIRLFAMGKGSTLATVKEEVLGESSSSSSLSRKSFKKSFKKTGFDDLSTGALLELSEIKVR